MSHWSLRSLLSHAAHVIVHIKKEESKGGKIGNVSPNVTLSVSNNRCRMSGRSFSLLITGDMLHGSVVEVLLSS